MAKGSVNKVIILGRLGQDPDVKATANGTQVANLSVATTEIGPKNDQGQRTETTEWHRVVLFGRTAEIAAQYLNKGSQVYVEGRLQTRKWQDQTGADRWSTEIVGFEMQLMGGKQDNQNQPQQNQMQQNQTQQNFQQQQQTQRQPQQQNNQQQPSQPVGFDDFDDDIPF